MSVLLLRLAGPMQSWGTQSRFSQPRHWPRTVTLRGDRLALCRSRMASRPDSLDDFLSLKMAVARGSRRPAHARLPYRTERSPRRHHEAHSGNGPQRTILSRRRRFPCGPGRRTSVSRSSTPPCVAGLGLSLGRKSLCRRCRSSPAFHEGMLIDVLKSYAVDGTEPREIS